MTRGAASGRPRRRTSSGHSGADRLQLLVFVEGSRTEVQYINDWYRRHRTQVLVEIDDRHGTPVTLVEAAISAMEHEKREARRSHGRAHDEYWCVFDRDEHPRFDEAVKLARDNGIRLAISNPCLELWFVWHFAEQNAHIERHEVQRRAAQLLGCDKNLSPAALAELNDAGNYSAAVGRAVQADKRHSGDGSKPGSNPSSSMHLLIERVRGS